MNKNSIKEKEKAYTTKSESDQANEKYNVPIKQSQIVKYV